MHKKPGVPAEDGPEDAQDDLQEDEIQEDDSSEDTDEDTDDTTQDEDSEVQSDDEDKETDQDKSPVFFDPNKLPEELKPVWKKMQASFTQKMQVASAVVQKSEAFDTLVKDPKFRDWMEARRRGEDSPTTSKHDSSEDKGSRGGGIRKIIRDELNALVEPLRQRVAEIDGDIKSDKTEAEYNTFKEKYPFFEPYKEDLKEALARNPALTYEQALAIVVFPDLMKRVGKEFRNVPQKKRANISKPGKTTLKETTDALPKTVHDAYLLAKKQLGSGGR